MALLTLQDQVKFLFHNVSSSSTCDAINYFVDAKMLCFIEIMNDLIQLFRTN